MKTEKFARTVLTSGMILVVVLALAACGGESADVAGSASEVGPSDDVAADVTSSTTTAAPDRVTVEAWVVSVSDEWSQLNNELIALSFEDFNADDQTDDTIVTWLTWIRAEADAYDAFAGTLEQVPEGSGFEDAAQTFVAELRGVVSSLRTLADDMAADPALQGSVTDGVALGEVQDRRDAFAADAQLACFPFQEAIAATDSTLPLIDCANTSFESPEYDVQPRGNGDVAAGFFGDVEAGTYQFGEFARPFAIEFAEVTSIELMARDLEVRPVVDPEWPEYYAFWIVTSDTLPTPGTPYGPIGETVPFPEDLSSWLVESGLEIVAEGTTELAQCTAPYWTVAVPDWTIETSGGGLVFATSDDGPFGERIYPIRHNTTLWQIPHPDGPFVVLALEKWEIPGAPRIDEVTERVEAIVATIEAIDGPGVPPTTTTTPTDDSINEPAETEAEVAALREVAMGLEGFDTHVNSEGDVYVYCDTPHLRSSTLIVAGVNRFSAAQNMGFELLEFSSAADRDGHFADVVAQSKCESADEETYDSELIEEDPGKLLIYSTDHSWPDGSQTFVRHIIAVGDTGMISISAGNLAGVNAVLAELELD